MTQEEINTIVQAVVDALLTNGQTIAQLTTATDVSEDDYFELSNGRKVSFATLKSLIESSSSGGGSYDGIDEVVTFAYTIASGLLTLKQDGRTSKTITIPLATTSQRGLMSATDKATLATAASNASDALDGLDEKANFSWVYNALESYCPKGSGTKDRIFPIYSVVVNLASMGETLDEVDGGTYSYTATEKDAWYDPSTSKIRYWWEGAAGYSSYTPSSEVVYYNVVTGRFYLWNGSAMVDFVATKAGNERLKVTQAAPAVLASMGTTLDNVNNTSAIQYVYSPSVGDTYLSNGVLYYKKSSSNTINLGAPDELTIYCNAHTNLLYRWNGSAMVAAGGSGSGSGTESDPVFTASAAYGISSSDISNWNSKTSNTGTITGITMNGSSMGTSGVVNLGTVLTSHQSLSGYAKYVLCADEAAYTAIGTYDSDTLYLIPES